MTISGGDCKAQWVKLFWNFIVFFQVRSNTKCQINDFLDFNEPGLFTFFQRIRNPINFLLIIWQEYFSLYEFALAGISEREFGIVTADL